MNRTRRTNTKKDGKNDGKLIYNPFIPPFYQPKLFNENDDNIQRQQSTEKSGWKTDKAIYRGDGK